MGFFKVFMIVKEVVDFIGQLISKGVIKVASLGKNKDNVG